MFSDSHTAPRTAADGSLKSTAQLRGREVYVVVMSGLHYSAKIRIALDRKTSVVGHTS